MDLSISRAFRLRLCYDRFKSLHGHFGCFTIDLEAFSFRWVVIVLDELLGFTIGGFRLMTSRSVRRVLTCGAIAVAATATLAFTTQFASASASATSGSSRDDVAKCKSSGKSEKKSKDCEKVVVKTSTADKQVKVEVTVKPSHPASSTHKEGDESGNRADKLADRPSGNGSGANDKVNSPTPGKGNATGNPLCFNNGKGNTSPVGNAHHGDCAKKIVAKPTATTKPADPAKPVPNPAPSVAKSPTEVLGAQVAKPASPATTTAPKASDPAPGKGGALAHTGSSIAQIISLAAGLLAFGLVMLAILKLRKSHAEASHDSAAEVSA